MNDSPATSLTLLERVQARQPAAWERLVDLYAPLVLHWCRRGGLQHQDADDVFQEVFRSVAEHVNDFRRDRPGDSFRGWLRTITRHKVLDHFRRRQQQAVAAGGSDVQRQLLEVPDPLGEDPDAAENELLTRQLHRALEDIRPEVEEKTWQAFWQVQIDNREPREVAAELGMTPAAVRKARYRVLERLRQELGDLLD
jgi:RNA polymerase sigma-70 factor (ECF subfamily)